MLHIEVNGTHLAMGRQQGRQLSELISLVVERSNRYPDGTRPAILAEAKRIEATLQARAPHLVSEMQGIAEGAGLPYEEILLLNTGYDASGDMAAPHYHCTGIGLPDTSDGPLVAKTDDVAIEERDFEVFFQVEPQDGHACLHYAFAGTIWDQGGINDAGLALAMTGLGPTGPYNTQGMPTLLFLREVLLRCGSVEEALTFAESHPLRGHGCTMTMADPTSGDITVVENLPSLRAVRRSRRGATVHTNHPQFPESLPLARDEKWAQRLGHPDLAANSQARARNAKILTERIAWSVDGLKQLLGDHTETGAICQHGQAGLHTSFAVILIPQQRALLAAEGYGCDPYVQHVF